MLRGVRRIRKLSGGQFARRTARWCGQLGDLLAAATGLLQAGGLDQLQLGRDQLEDLADVLADQAQGAAAFRAIITGVQHDAFTEGALGHQGLAAARGVGRRSLFFCAKFGVVIWQGGADRSRPCNVQMLQRQFQLFDLAQGAFRVGPELLLLQPCDLDLKRLNQRLMRAQGGGYRSDIGLNANVLGCNPGILCLQTRDHHLQGGGVIRQDYGHIGHGRSYHAAQRNTIKTSKNRVVSSQLWPVARPSPDAATCVGTTIPRIVI